MILEITNYTWIVTIVGFAIVFSAATILAILFSYLPKIIRIKFDFKSLKQGKIDESIQRDKIDVNAHEIAAIAMSISLYFNEFHDDESNIITIKNIQKPYSPWSSKLYSMNNVIYMNTPKKL